MEVKGLCDEVSDGNEEHVIRKMKGDLTSSKELA